MKKVVDSEYVSEYDRAWNKIFSELDILEFIKKIELY